MSANGQDPVALMLEGKLEEATREYLDLYLEALEAGDRFIGADLVTQLHYCVAGTEEGRSPEEVSQRVEDLLSDAVAERGLDIDLYQIKEDVAIARKGVLTGRKKAEKSIERVGQEKDLRWKGING